MSSIKNKMHHGKLVKKSRMLPFHAGNYLLFGVGIIVIVIGFIALSQGQWNGLSSLTIAPILLVIGYLIIVPLAIFYKKKNIQKEGETKKVE